jgi:hypothetical protein
MCLCSENAANFVASLLWHIVCLAHSWINWVFSEIIIVEPSSFRAQHSWRVFFFLSNYENILYKWEIFVIKAQHFIKIMLSRIWFAMPKIGNPFGTAARQRCRITIYKSAWVLFPTPTGRSCVGSTCTSERKTRQLGIPSIVKGGGLMRLHWDKRSYMFRCWEYSSTI